MDKCKIKYSFSANSNKNAFEYFVYLVTCLCFISYLSPFHDGEMNKFIYESSKYSKNQQTKHITSKLY